MDKIDTAILGAYNSMFQKEVIKEAITKRGSQSREPIEDTDYEFVREGVPVLPGKEAILRDKETGKLELWAQNDDYAGYVIEIKGRGYEFVRSLPDIKEDIENDAELMQYKKETETKDKVEPIKEAFYPSEAHDATELINFGNNDEKMLNMKQDFWKNLEKFEAKGEYNHEMAFILFKKFATKLAENYVKLYKPDEKYYELFPKNVRSEAAEFFLNQFEQ